MLRQNKYFQKNDACWRFTFIGETKEEKMKGPWKEFDQTFQTNDSLLKHIITSKLQALQRTYTFMELVTELKTRVNNILSKITASHEPIYEFTIGKSRVEKDGTSVFDHMNTDTWDKSNLHRGVLGRWTNEYKKDGYTGLVILCAVPSGFLPPKDSNSTAEQIEGRKMEILTSENYVLALEQHLINHYAFTERDHRLGNTSSNTGGPSYHEAGAYVLYLAYQLQSSKDKADKEKKKKDEEEKKKKAAEMKTTEDKNNKTEGKEDGNHAVEKHEE